MLQNKEKLHRLLHQGYVPGLSPEEGVPHRKDDDAQQGVWKETYFVGVAWIFFHLQEIQILKNHVISYHFLFSSVH